MKNKKLASLLLILMMVSVACASTPKKRSFGETIDDSVISNKLKAKYVKDKEVKALKVNIDTWKGVVTLKGYVDTPEQAQRAVDLAEQEAGVKEVKSYLAVRGSQDQGISPKPSEREESDNPWNQPRAKKTSAGVTERDLKSGQTETIGAKSHGKADAMVNAAKKQKSTDSFIDDSETAKPSKIRD